MIYDDHDDDGDDDKNADFDCRICDCNRAQDYEHHEDAHETFSIIDNNIDDSDHDNHGVMAMITALAEHVSQRANKKPNRSANNAGKPQSQNKATKHNKRPTN